MYLKNFKKRGVSKQSTAASAKNKLMPPITRRRFTSTPKLNFNKANLANSIEAFAIKPKSSTEPTKIEKSTAIFSKKQLELEKEPKKSVFDLYKAFYDVKNIDALKDNKTGRLLNPDPVDQPRTSSQFCSTASIPTAAPKTDFVIDETDHLMFGYRLPSVIRDGRVEKLKRSEQLLSASNNEKRRESVMAIAEPLYKLDLGETRADRATRELRQIYMMKGKFNEQELEKTIMCQDQEQQTSLLFRFKI